MKIKQLSLFLENKPAHLLAPCQALADAGVNILTLALADTQQFGILRIIVREWERAKEVLEDAGCVVKVSDVLAIEVPDRPGGLAELLQLIEEIGANIEYMYAFTFGREDKAIMIFRFEDPETVLDQLRKRAVGLVESVSLFTRCGEQ
jgi:hypothetical protein